MKKSVMKRWVKALRSGEYLQTKEYLASQDEKGNDSFCCLGVLCNIMQEETGKLVVTKDLRNKYSFDNEGSTLPKSVINWSGLRNSQGHFRDNYDKSQELTALNDEGKSFKEIANIIEKNYEKL